MAMAAEQNPHVHSGAGHGHGNKSVFFKTEIDAFARGFRESGQSSVASSAHQNRKPFKSVANVLKSKESFGGGLILMGGDRVKTELQPRPDIHGSIITNTRRIQSVDLEPEPWESKEKARKSRYKEFGEIPTNHAKSRGKSVFAVPETSKQEALDASIPTRRACKKAAFPRMKPKPVNQYCDSNLLRKKSVSEQALMNKRCDSRVDWDLGMPATFNTLPIYTVRVRWRIGSKVQCYTLEVVHALLCRHGSIEAIGQHSANSAIVVFTDVQSARRCLRCCKEGSCPLICSWWFKEMYSYTRMMHEQSIREEKKYPVHMSEATILMMQFQLAQKKCDIQRKSYAGLLSYNSECFNP